MNFHRMRRFGGCVSNTIHNKMNATHSITIRLIALSWMCAFIDIYITTKSKCIVDGVFCHSLTHTHTMKFHTMNVWMENIWKMLQFEGNVQMIVFIWMLKIDFIITRENLSYYWQSSNENEKRKWTDQ